MYFEPQIRKQSKQTFKPVTQCLGACALTPQAMLASKMMLECGSDTRKRVLVVAVIEPFKD
jgi:NADH:ubiquinone oxidoreductase subunit E